MGQRMPPGPIEYGDDCLSCFAAGKTPKYVYVRFSGVDHCNVVGPPASRTPPNNRLFKLAQHPTIACEWRYEPGDWEIEYRAFWPATGGSYLDLFDENGREYFRDNRAACEPEGTVWHNEYVGCVGAEYGNGGIAVITWTPQATSLLEAINLYKGPDLFMELFPREDGKLVYKFCRLKDATNIKILFEP